MFQKACSDSFRCFKTILLENLIFFIILISAHIFLSYILFSSIIFSTWNYEVMKISVL